MVRIPCATFSRGIGSAALALAALAASAHATTYNVNTTSMSLVNDGNCGLREAIAAINAGTAQWGCPAPSGTSETIYLPPGTYTSQVTLTFSKSLNMICNGPGACNIDAGNITGPLFLVTGAIEPHLYLQKIVLRQPSANANSVTGISVESGSVGMEDGTITGFKLNGLVISGGSGSNASRTTFSNNATLGVFVAPDRDVNLSNCTLTGNTGSAIVTGPNAIVYSQGNIISNHGQSGVGLSQFAKFYDDGSTISNNTGAGIDGAGDVYLTRTVVRGNLNGGVRMDGGQGEISYATIEGNRTSGSGGGIAVLVPSFMTIRSTTISNNKASGNGGGLYMTGGANIYHCTISNDTATRGGGFYHNPGGAGGNAYVEVYQGTIAFNRATVSGGGVHPISGSSPFRTFGCIVAQNTAPTHPDVSGYINSQNSMFSTTPGSPDIDPSLNYFPFNPLLGPLMDNAGPNRVKTHALLKGSPALDKINAPGGIALDGVDQRGFPRLVSPGLWDLGAYEDGPFETELLTVIGQSSDAHYVNAENGLSNGKGTILDANAVNDFVTYAVAIPDPGTYNFVVRVKRGPQRGIVELATAPGTTTFTPIATLDLYRSSPGFTNLATSFAFTSAGIKHFRFRVTGKNASSSGYLVYLDYVRLTKQ